MEQRTDQFSSLLQQQQQLENDFIVLDHTTALVEEQKLKSQAAEKIRSTVETIAVMYKRLHEMTHVQEEMTLRIDSDVDHVLDNVESAHFELQRYLHRIRSHTGLLIKIFILITIFAVLFVTVLS
uniref:Syntaxin-32 n=1 Tax=Lygus hesperus TaxID=30085 RepID=A0A0A9YML7_LYGHE